MICVLSVYSEPLHHSWLTKYVSEMRALNLPVALLFKDCSVQAKHEAINSLAPLIAHVAQDDMQVLLDMVQADQRFCWFMPVQFKEVHGEYIRDDLEECATCIDDVVTCVSRYATDEVRVAKLYNKQRKWAVSHGAIRATTRREVTYYNSRIRTLHYADPTAEPLLYNRI